ncbi:unnamed protein product, partial [Phaeothamnion confervicola]
MAHTNFEPLSGDDGLNEVACVCIGAGRFLRAVLIPAIEASAMGTTILAQPRGTSFVRSVQATNGSYEVDTVNFDGSVVTTRHSVAAVGTLGTPEGLKAFLALPARLPKLKIVGVGVTEAGVALGSDAMRALALFLAACGAAGRGALSIINTDNVPGNGDAVRRFCLEALPADRPGARLYVAEMVTFHNTMVDRITAHRPGDPLVPSAELLPPKALVIEDLEGV